MIKPAISQFAIDGDLAAYLRALEARPRAGDDPTGMRAAYRRAMLAHDYTAADQALTDPRLKEMNPPGDTAAAASEPVALHRALVAFLTNQKDTARRFAEAAIADYRQRTWTPYQQRFVAVGIALAKALAGRGDEAVREGGVAADQAVKSDAWQGPIGIYELGLIYLVLDRRDEALATLKRFVDGPTVVTISEIRVDPFRSRLKDDPRFEEILNSAKPL